MSADLVTEEQEVPSELPLIPLRDLIIFPNLVVPLFVGRERSIVALEEAMKSASRPGSSMFTDASKTSCGMGLPRRAHRSKSPTRLRMRAWTSTGAVVFSSRTSTLTMKYGSVWVNSLTFIRMMPSTRAFAVPSGSFSSCITVATQPILYRSFWSGSCVSGSRCVTSATL